MVQVALGGFLWNFRDFSEFLWWWPGIVSMLRVTVSPGFCKGLVLRQRLEIVAEAAGGCGVACFVFVRWREHCSVVVEL